MLTATAVTLRVMRWSPWMSATRGMDVGVLQRTP